MAANTATHSHASAGARCALGGHTGSAVTERMITEMTTTTVRYGRAVRSLCARRPEGNAEHRLCDPAYHTAAHTMTIASAIGTDRRLAQSHNGCEGCRVFGSARARARSESVASTKNTAIDGTSTATIKTQCLARVPAEPDTNCTTA